MSAFLNQQLLILPGRFQPSTFSVYGLNYCVRYGNRWNPIAIATGFSPTVYNNPSALLLLRAFTRRTFQYDSFTSSSRLASVPF